MEEKKPRGFQKGQSGNPNGRPKGPTIMGLKTKKIDLSMKFLRASEDNWDELLTKLFAAALEGNTKAMFFIIDHALYKLPAKAIENQIEKAQMEMNSVEIMQMLQEVREKRRELEMQNESVH